MAQGKVVISGCIFFAAIYYATTNHPNHLNDLNEPNDQNLSNERLPNKPNKLNQQKNRRPLLLPRPPSPLSSFRASQLPSLRPCAVRLLPCALFYPKTQ
jgi:hypothetical protein